MKIPVLLRLDSDLVKALARHKAETGVPTAEYIRRLLRLALFADTPTKVETRRSQPVLLRPEVR
jgi:predicted DNA binding CopG/RHH family protein